MERERQGNSECFRGPELGTERNEGRCVYSREVSTQLKNDCRESTSVSE